MKSIIAILLTALTLAGCGSGAVVFAPTPLPPDVSPLRYEHPSGVFAVVVPRTWSAFVQNTTVLAGAAFAAPGADEPSLRFAVVNLGERLDSAALGELMNRYQTQIRTDAGRYREIDRAAMGDGSWRLTGLRQTVGGLTQQINTFIQQSGMFLSLIEVVMPPDNAEQNTLQMAINSFAINPDANLQTGDAAALAAATVNDLDILHVTTWTTPAGVFFITGEVGNYGVKWVADVPVRAVLRTADGLGVAEAADMVMGFGIAPGGFAPFSLRFGQGQSALTAGYQLILGGDTWTPGEVEPVYGQETLTWTDDSAVSPEGRLTISGSVRNTGADTVYTPRAVVTVFDAQGDVIAAGFNDVAPSLTPGASVDFQVVIPEIGGAPVNYIVSFQGRA